MGLRCAPVVVLFAVTAALAQEKQLISAPISSFLQTPNWASLSFRQAVARSFDDHHWYWETDGLTIPSGAYRFQASRDVRPHQGTFAPGKLVWDLSGKHKLLPMLDLTVVKLRPGQPTLIQQKPTGEFGTFVSKPTPTRLWNKATRSLTSAMHR